MLEVEMKFRVDDPAILQAKLTGWTAHPERQEEDHYFNAPDRDFAITDEALRIRTIGDQNLLTYKGPKLDKQTKTRFEQELPLPRGPEGAQLWWDFLTRLGYRPVGVVRKSRRAFAMRRGRFNLLATIDRVEDVGTYAELELVVDEADREDAKSVVLKCAEELGLHDPERRSYLTLWLASRNQSKSQLIVSTVSELRRAVTSARRRGMTIGFVPTMGALHAGHSALIERAESGCNFVVVSIFVNPTQFGPDEDFQRYPRTLDADIALCRDLGVDLIYVPDVTEIYPEKFTTFVEIGQLGEIYEGAMRPGHFRGVGTVVLKLLNQVNPDMAYFGQKDAQQVAVIRQLVRDFDVPVRLAVVPTVREPDGLALSSRNRYLGPAQRRQATILHKALSAARQLWQTGQRDAQAISDLMSQTVAGEPNVVLDYAAVVDPLTFGPPAQTALAIIAVSFGSTRLIDNMLLEG